MCGRYVLFTPGDDLARLFNIIRFERLQPRYNIAPTQNAPVIRLGADGVREMVPLRWGLIPAAARASDDGPRPINARSETVRDRPLFREAFRRRRCLIPADGFYEWKKIGPFGKDQIRQPMFVRVDEGGPFVMAGLWEAWQPPPPHAPDMPDVPPVETFTILTTDAAATIRGLHDRMPVILDTTGAGGRGGAAVWLDEAASEDDLLALCKPVADDRLTFHAVSRRVNRAEVEGPACIEPVEEAQPPQSSLF